MSVGAEISAVLDELVAAVAAAGIPATRDPGDFQPPGSIIEAPTITGAATMGSLGLTVPVYVVSDQPPNASGLDWMLEAVGLLLPVFGDHTATPTKWYGPINPAGLPAYLITLRVNASS